MHRGWKTAAAAAMAAISLGIANTAQAGSDRTCGTGGPTDSGQYVCFAHTITAPHGANAGAWLTVRYYDNFEWHSFNDFYSVVR